MFILKIIRTFLTPEIIYNNVPHKVEEDEQYIELDKTPVIQTLQNEGPTRYAVISGVDTYFIQDTDHAYLLNGDGKTLKIIHRP